MGRATVLLAVRRLILDRAYSAVTIGGLALGLAGALMILAYIRYEQSYDGWLAEAGRVYQVQSTIHPPGQPDVETQESAPALAGALPEAFPEIEAATSLAKGKTVTERDGQPVFIEATTVAPDFFKVLALPFVRGSAATALPDTNSIVLTEAEAIREFGTTDVLGRRFTLGAGAGKRDYRVSGVLRDLPPNSSLSLGIVYRAEPAQEPVGAAAWYGVGRHIYVKLRTGADPRALTVAIAAWKQRAMPAVPLDGKQVSLADAYAFHLVPLTDVHLSATQAGALTPGGDSRSLATFAIVAVLTLTMAVINFVNLTTARAIRRGREVALRKVLGATRRQLIGQFLGESALVSGLAMLVALTLVEIGAPWIGHVIGVELRIFYGGANGLLLPALGLFAVTTLAGGLYPAVAVGRLDPAPILHGTRGSAETAGSGRLRGGLVILQFAIAIGLIASTVIIFSQTRFVQRVDPGYRRDGLVQIDNAWRFTQGSEYEAARAAMLAIPGVTAVGRTGRGLASADASESLMRAAGGAEYQTMKLYSVDADFLRVIDVDLLAGRLLGDRLAADRIAEGTSLETLAARGVNIVVNRAAAAKFGFRAPRAAIGQPVEVAFGGGTMVPARIAGVVENTRFGSARDTIDPIVYAYQPEMTQQVLVRYAAARPGEVMAALNEVWRRFEPEIPFEARFADDIVADLYAAERARGLLFAVFSLLAVVIACLGLYSLAAFATERRTREIGIRKVVGAKVRDIVRLLAWQFCKPVVLANLLAWPVAWWAMRDWLNGFDQRIALGPGPFALAGLLALAIALVTVAGQSLRAARAHPVHALRHE